MIKNTKKQDITQSKSNLLQLFRKRIQTRSNKNTPVHPSSLKPTLAPAPSHLSSNNPRQRLTPSKTSAFSLNQPSQLSLTSQGYSNPTKQLLVCNIHNNKQAKFIRQNTEEYYCEKCAILLTNEGLRLTQIDGFTKIKKTLELMMNRQVEAVRKTYGKVIEMLSVEMEREIQRVREHFGGLRVDERVGKVEVSTFVGSSEIQKVVEKVKQSIGKIVMKKITLETPKVQSEMESYKERESHRLSHRRNSQKSTTKKPPAQIMINLCIHQEEIMDKENKEINVLV